MSSVTATVVTDCLSSTYTQIGVKDPVPNSTRNGSPSSSSDNATETSGKVVRRSWVISRPASVSMRSASGGSSLMGISHLLGISYLTSNRPLNGEGPSLNRIDQIVNDFQLQDIPGIDGGPFPPSSLISVGATLHPLLRMDVLVAGAKVEIPREQAFRHLTVDGICHLVAEAH